MILHKATHYRTDHFWYARLWSLEQKIFWISLVLITSCQTLSLTEKRFHKSPDVRQTQLLGKFHSLNSLIQNWWVQTVNLLLHLPVNMSALLKWRVGFLTRFISVPATAGMWFNIGPALDPDWHTQVCLLQWRIFASRGYSAVMCWETRDIPAVSGRISSPSPPMKKKQDAFILFAVYNLTFAAVALVLS